MSQQTINPATNKPYTGGDIVSVFFSVLMGSFAIGQAAPSFPAFANAKGTNDRDMPYSLPSCEHSILFNRRIDLASLHQAPLIVFSR
jgi:hypothetical protein